MSGHGGGIPRVVAVAPLAACWGTNRLAGAKAPEVTFAFPRDRAIGPQGNVYVVNAGLDTITWFDGASWQSWGSTGGGDGQFLDPPGVGVTSSGAVYVTDLGVARVQHFGPTGAFVLEWTIPGAATDVP